MSGVGTVAVVDINESTGQDAEASGGARRPGRSPAWAMVRVDVFQLGERPTAEQVLAAVTVTSVFDSGAGLDDEVDRLNALNGDRGVCYAAICTRRRANPAT